MSSNYISEQRSILDLSLRETSSTIENEEGEANGSSFEQMDKMVKEFKDLQLQKIDDSCLKEGQQAAVIQSKTKQRDSIKQQLEKAFQYLEKKASQIKQKENLYKQYQARINQQRIKLSNRRRYQVPT